jgi:hypothetical protein
MKIATALIVTVILSFTFVLATSSKQEKPTVPILIETQEVKDLKTEIIRLQEIKQGMSKSGGVTVGALVLNNNPEDLNRLRKELWTQILSSEMQQTKSEVQTPSRVKLTGDLTGQEEKLLSSFSSPDIGRMVIAVAFAESGGGKNACAKHNAWSIMREGKCISYASVDEAVKDIKSKTGVYYNKLSKIGVTESNINQVFVGKGKYCTYGCENFTRNFLYYYNLQSN